MALVGTTICGLAPGKVTITSVNSPGQSAYYIRESGAQADSAGCFINSIINEIKGATSYGILLVAADTGGNFYLPSLMLSRTAGK